MFKVSFKDDFMKVQTFNDKATVVTLKGTVIMPEWSEHIPHEITEWVYTHPSVDVHDSWIGGTLKMFIEACGKAKCAEGDSFDPELGKRIAESRAKIKIYKFMFTLTRKLINYYTGLLVGTHNKVDIYHSSPTSLVDANHKYYMLWETEDMHLEKLLRRHEQI